jgi:hypothetical protein
VIIHAVGPKLSIETPDDVDRLLADADRASVDRL